MVKYVFVSNEKQDFHMLLFVMCAISVALLMHSNVGFNCMSLGCFLVYKKMVSNASGAEILSTLSFPLNRERVKGL